LAPPRGRANLQGIGVTGASARRTGFIVYGFLLFYAFGFEELAGPWYIESIAKLSFQPPSRRFAMASSLKSGVVATPHFRSSPSLAALDGQVVVLQLPLLKSRLWRASARQRICIYVTMG